MELLGYVSAGLVGVLLGLIGAGGSILIVPIMVFLFGLPQVISSSYSLFLVGVSSLIGAILRCKDRQVQIKSAVTFGIVSTSIVLVIRRYVIPLVSDKVYHVGSISLSYKIISMLLFSLLMIGSAIVTIKLKNNVNHQLSKSKANLLKCAILVGMVTGLLGAGGGFLIVPALMIFLQLDMKKAVATSLAIITLNALSGFLIDVTQLPIDWSFLLTITGIAVLGSIVGTWFAKKLDSKQLKMGFGWFVLILGLIILLTEGNEIIFR
jgi:uncharacterized membrane protein YfcA